jgi:magnesium-transporting ATPase (P-type)
VFVQVSLFLFEDSVRPAAARVISFLRSVAGLKTVMLTGDHEASARQVAGVVGLGKEDVFAGLKPEDKVSPAVLSFFPALSCCVVRIWGMKSWRGRFLFEEGRGWQSLGVRHPAWIERQNAVLAALSDCIHPGLMRHGKDGIAGLLAMPTCRQDKECLNYTVFVRSISSSRNASVQHIIMEETPKVLPSVLLQLRHVTKLSNRQDKNGGLIMVGDGINDAPALAAATVGVVLAERASATATAAADVLLLQDDMDGVSFAVMKAKQTLAVVKQSIFFALLCMSIAAVPAVSGIIPLWLTVIVHEGSTVLVSLNALRVLRTPRWRIEDKETRVPEKDGALDLAQKSKPVVV